MVWLADWRHAFFFFPLYILTYCSPDGVVTLFFPDCNLDTNWSSYSNTGLLETLDLVMIWCKDPPTLFIYILNPRKCKMITSGFNWVLKSQTRDSEAAAISRVDSLTYCPKTVSVGEGNGRERNRGWGRHESFGWKKKRQARRLRMNPRLKKTTVRKQSTRISHHKSN